jgi:peroxiredoxin
LIQAQSDLTTLLTGTKLPPVSLVDTGGNTITLATLSGCTVVYIYPRTSPQNEPPIPGWADISGAKDCTPQSCGFRDHHGDLRAAGVTSVFGLSTQDRTFQSEVVARLTLPFPLLPDSALKLQSALNLPVVKTGGMTLLERFTMVIDDGVITKVFHPIPDPQSIAQDILTYFSNRV